MANSLSRDEVRSLDRRAIEVLGAPGVILMENAGRGAADAIERFLQTAVGKRVAIVAGAGNNGGDGYVVARHLHIRGAHAVIFLVAESAKITGDAQINLTIACNLGIEVRELSAAQIENLSTSLRDFDLVVDAVGGTGIRGALKGPQAQAVEQINAAQRPVAALDIPTGLDCDTGGAAGPVIHATFTVTFAARKKGFDAPGAERYTGKVIVADIGVPVPL